MSEISAFVLEIPFHVRTKDLKKDSATLFIRIHTRKVDVLVSTMLQLHAKPTQIEGIVKAHLAKVNFDREALDMDVRFIS
ncbi:hypothetical protein, partial [Xylanibacter rodentium]